MGDFMGDEVQQGLWGLTGEIDGEVDGGDVRAMSIPPAASRNGSARYLSDTSFEADDGGVVGQEDIQIGFRDEAEDGLEGIAQV